jgi:hypothetical protein
MTSKGGKITTPNSSKGLAQMKLSFGPPASKSKEAGSKDQSSSN